MPAQPRVPCVGEELTAHGAVVNVSRDIAPTFSLSPDRLVAARKRRARPAGSPARAGSAVRPVRASPTPASEESSDGAIAVSRNPLFALAHPVPPRQPWQKQQSAISTATHGRRGGCNDDASSERSGTSADCTSATSGTGRHLAFCAQRVDFQTTCGAEGAGTSTSRPALVPTSASNRAHVPDPTRRLSTHAATVPVTRPPAPSDAQRVASTCTITSPPRVRVQCPRYDQPSGGGGGTPRNGDVLRGCEGAVLAINAALPAASSSLILETPRCVSLRQTGHMCCFRRPPAH